MNRAVKISLWVLTLLLVGLLAVWCAVRVPNTNKPYKLPNVPKNAVWKGDVDEGFWLEIVNVNTLKKTYRIKVYNDYQGELVMDADFSKANNCNSVYPLNPSIINQVSYFEFDKIVMTDNCILNIIKPVYGGSFSQEVETE